MRSRLLSGVPLVALLAWTGCAPSVTGAAPEAPDPVAEARAAVAARPPLPGQADMLPAVELVTFEYRRGDGTRRDTVRGAAATSDWLERLRARTEGTPSPFDLEPVEILICEGAAVERGRYGIGQRIRDQEYVALWRPVETDWKLERLWLAPARVRANRLAPGCRGGFDGFKLGAAIGGSGAVGFDQVVSALSEDGYVERSRSGSVRPAAHAWAALEVSPRTSFRFTYGYIDWSRMEARVEALYPRTVDLEASVQLFTLTGELKVGPVWVGAGPALSLVQVNYVEETEHTSGSYFQKRYDRLASVGVTTRVSYRLGLVSKLSGLGSVGYTYFPAMDLDRTVLAPVTVPGPDVVLGLEWAF